MFKVYFTIMSLSILLYLNLTAQIIHSVPGFENFPILKGPYFGQTPPGKDDINIWYFEKKDNEWSKPKLMSFYPNTNENWEFFLCQINDGSFYYTRNNVETNSKFNFGLAKASYFEGKYIEPILLDQRFNDGNLNWTPCVDPDETYIIFSSNRNDLDSGINGCDLFISYRDETGEWSVPIDMGPSINKPGIIERFPQVTLDKKYFFFIRGFGDFYWIDAEIINDLRKKQ